MIGYFKRFYKEWSERLLYDGLTYDELCASAGGGGKGSSGSSQRKATAEEKRLWASQAENLDSMTEIAEDQYQIGKEDREYYERVFRDGTDTEAKEAVAKLRSQITGEEVDPDSIVDASIDTLLRDTLLTASPEFRESAGKVIESNEQLTEKYGAELTGLSQGFSDSIKGFTEKYQSEIGAIKDAAGTIDDDMLSRETGAALGGISTAYDEARKQMGGNLARRGLAGSGAEQDTMSDMYMQEAQAKAGAGTQARGTALEQSELRRSQQAQLAGQELQAGVSGAGQAYNAEVSALQNLYGVQTQSNLQNYQLDQAAQLQGIAGLTQVAQAGQGLYTGSQNYLAQAGQTAGSAANIAGQGASNLANADVSYQNAIAQQNAASSAGMGQLAGTLAAGAAMYFSDFRFKNNIKLDTTIGDVNFYTWEWNDFAIDYIGKDNLSEPYGVIAQELQMKYPEFVHVDENGYLRVDYSSLNDMIEEL